MGNEIIVVHGNGPQVGMINLGLAHSAACGVISAEMPFPKCGAMSQGYIGYHLQNALLKGLPKVKAAVKFAESKKERSAVICSLEKALPALKGESGTRVY